MKVKLTKQRIVIYEMLDNIVNGNDANIELPDIDLTKVQNR